MVLNVTGFTAWTGCVQVTMPGFTAWTGCVQVTMLELIALHADGGTMPWASMLPFTAATDFSNVGGVWVWLAGVAGWAAW